MDKKMDYLQSNIAILEKRSKIKIGSMERWYIDRK